MNSHIENIYWIFLFGAMTAGIYYCVQEIKYFKYLNEKGIKRTTDFKNNISRSLWLYGFFWKKVYLEVESDEEFIQRSKKLANLFYFIQILVVLNFFFGFVVMLLAE